MERPHELRTDAGPTVYAYRNLFDDVRLVIGSATTLTLTAREARQLAAMLRDAAPGDDAQH